MIHSASEERTTAARARACRFRGGSNSSDSLRCSVDPCLPGRDRSQGTRRNNREIGTGARQRRADAPSVTERNENVEICIYSPDTRTGICHARRSRARRAVSRVGREISSRAKTETRKRRGSSGRSVSFISGYTAFGIFARRRDIACKSWSPEIMVAD